MSNKVTYERGKTLTYPTMYPQLLMTPEFAHRGDFTWIERVICQWDAEPVGKGNEFGFIRDNAHSERCDKLEAESAKLRELAKETIRLMQADGPDCGLCKHYSECWTGEAMNYSPTGCIICNEARELGIEVDS